MTFTDRKLPQGAQVNGSKLTLSKCQSQALQPESSFPVFTPNCPCEGCCADVQPKEVGGP